MLLISSQQSKTSSFWAISDIEQQVSIYIAEKRGAALAKVVSAVELNESTQKNLKAALKNKLGRDVELSLKVDSSVIGGIKVTEPAADLGIALAIVSSFKDISPKESTIVIGEIGLSGELRRIQNITKRIEEAQKMGFTKIIIPNLQSKEIQDHKIKVIGVSNLKEAINSYFSH